VVAGVGTEEGIPASRKQEKGPGLSQMMKLVKAWKGGERGRRGRKGRRGYSPVTEGGREVINKCHVMIVVMFGTWKESRTVESGLSVESFDEEKGRGYDKVRTGPEGEKVTKRPGEVVS
jgi:hypothetical protein